MRVWIDIDNAPHVQIFRPIIESLRERGADVEVTARDRTYVSQMLDRAGIPSTVIGRGQPKGAVGKLAALSTRTAALVRFARGRRFDVAAGHGSRSLPPAARAAGVRNLTMFDYEHVSTWLFRRFCDRILIPRAVADATNGSLGPGPWRTYEGFKEEIYLSGFAADPHIRDVLGVGPSETLVVIRPPSRTAHYHDRRSEEILAAVIERLRRKGGMRTVWLRRDPGDQVPDASELPGLIVPESPVDGPSLLAAADLAISGGGTMNREAALLGTPAYSIFTGPVGALDAHLDRAGKLTIIRDAADLDRIHFARKGARPHAPGRSRLRDFVVDQISDLARGQ